MEFLMHAVWAAMDLFFGWRMFSAFFAVKRQKEDAWWFLAMAWLVTALYAAFSVDSVSPVLVWLLAMVLMLMYLYQESSPRGLGILMLSCGILLICETAVLYVTGLLAGTQLRELPAVPYYLVRTVGKLLAILSAWLIGHYIAGQARRRDAQELELLLQRQHMEMQTESINALEQNYRMQRRITHEFEHHLQVLDDLLDSGELGEAKDYVRRLRGSRSYRVISVNSRHTVMDVILNQKYQTAQENGIRVQIRVNDLSQVTLPTDSLVVILSNLLDNAIEACRRLDGYTEIDCSVLYDEGLYIAIQNTSNPVQLVDGIIDTTKSDKLSHGYGLGNMCYLLDKLGAEYTFDWADGWFRFAAEIPN